MKRYILTGTPGAGKTSVIRGLEDLGYPIVEEAATAVIALRQAQGIDTPWTNPSFIDDIVTLQKQRQVQSVALPFKIQFHDRSPVCCHALSRFLGYPPSPLLMDEIGRIKKEQIFQNEVFFIRNLGFCEPTAARKITFEDSLLFEETHAESYRSFGYTVIDIEKKPMQERVADIVRVTG